MNPDILLQHLPDCSLAGPSQAALRDGGAFEKQTYSGHSVSIYLFIFAGTLCDSVTSGTSVLPFLFFFFLFFFFA